MGTTRSRSVGHVGQKVRRRQEPLSVETATPEAPVQLMLTYEAPRFDVEDVQAQLLGSSGGTVARADLDERTSRADVDELGGRTDSGQVKTQLSGHDGHHADAVMERQSAVGAANHAVWDAPLHADFPPDTHGSRWFPLGADTYQPCSPPVVEKFSSDAVQRPRLPERPPRKMPSMAKIERYWGLEHGYCARCGQPARCEKAHIIDRYGGKAGGGLDGPQNLVPLCYPCHHKQPWFKPGEEPLALVWVFNEYDWEGEELGAALADCSLRVFAAMLHLRIADTFEEGGRLLAEVRQADA